MRFFYSLALPMRGGSFYIQSKSNGTGKTIDDRFGLRVAVVMCMTVFCGIRNGMSEIWHSGHLAVRLRFYSVVCEDVIFVNCNIPLGGFTKLRNMI